MPAAYLTGLYWFAGILIIGIILSIIASKIKLPDVLLLLAFGIFLYYAKLFDISLISPAILAAFSIFALIMIIFDSTSRFKLKEVMEVSPYAIKIALIFLFLCVIFLTLFTHLTFFKIWSFKALLVTALFAALMCGTSPDIVLSIFTKTKNKIIEILQFESIINTPLIVIIPLVILDFYRGVFQANTLATQFLQQIMSGVGTGLVLGLIVFSLIKHRYFEKISPLIIIGTALGCYGLAEYINGNGVLAVTTLGLVFGRVYVKEKIELKKFIDVFTNFLKIIVFILLGMLIRVPLTASFFIKSGLLFLVYLVIRYCTINLSFRKTKITLREKLFMSLNIPKGVAVAVVVFILSTYKIPGLATLLSLTFAFIVYSIVLSSVVSFYSDYFLKQEPEKQVLQRLKTDKKEIEKSF